MAQKLGTDVSENIQTKKRFGTKAKAILAGGLVLGVGAAITLAAWTDQEWAKGSFASGTFGIEGSADGTTFGNHDTEAGAAALDFQVDADELSPGDTVYALFAVQLIATSDYAAEVEVTQTATTPVTGVTANYVYTTSAVCDDTAYLAGTDADVRTFDLAAVTTPQNICFKLTADNTLQQGKTGLFTWKFEATSGASLTP